VVSLPLLFPSLLPSLIPGTAFPRKEEHQSYSDNIADLLTPVAIAFWRAGNSTYVQGTLIICTDSLTAAEEETLRSILLDQYGIHPTRVSNGYKDQYRIRIAKASVATLQVLGLVSEPSPSPEHLPHSSTLNAIPCWPLKPLLFLLIQYFVLFLNPAATYGRRRAETRLCWNLVDNPSLGLGGRNTVRVQIPLAVY
jgi:hypothetical protein